MSEATPLAGRRRDERVLSGAPVAKRRCRSPDRSALTGAAVTLEPLDPGLHATDLFRAGHARDAASKVWTFMPYGPFREERSFKDWLQACATFNDPLFSAVRDHRSGHASGMASYLNIRPSDAVLEIGHIWFAPSLQRTRAATETLYLLIRRAFDELGFRRVEWKCNALNGPSRRAALRLGFRFEGIFYQHMIAKGCNRDTAWYSMLDEEWPQRRNAFMKWLAAENFDADGQQRASLGDLIDAS